MVWPKAAPGYAQLKMPVVTRPSRSGRDPAGASVPITPEQAEWDATFTALMQSPAVAAHLRGTLAEGGAQQLQEALRRPAGRTPGGEAQSHGVSASGSRRAGKLLGRWQCCPRGRHQPTFERKSGVRRNSGCVAGGCAGNSDRPDRRPRSFGRYRPASCRSGPRRDRRRFVALLRVASSRVTERTVPAVTAVGGAAVRPIAAGLRLGRTGAGNLASACKTPECDHAHRLRPAIGRAKNNSLAKAL